MRAMHEQIDRITKYVGAEGSSPRVQWLEYSKYLLTRKIPASATTRARAMLRSNFETRSQRNRSRGAEGPPAGRGTGGEVTAPPGPPR